MDARTRPASLQGDVLVLSSLGLAVLAAAASLALLAGIGSGGWPGESNGCAEEMRPQCFCEAPRPGLIAQPANTLSNFGFVVAGFAIAAVTDRRRRQSAAHANPMTSGPFYATIFAVVTVLLGPGSMALHATQTIWGGVVDVSSMYLYALLLILYGLARLDYLSKAGFLISYGAGFSALVAAQAAGVLSANYAFGALLVVAALLESWVKWRRPERTLDTRWLAAAFACFGVAFAIWVPSLTGGPLCDPDTLVQGHAAWHLLCAGSTLCLFAYYSSEQTPT